MTQIVKNPEALADLVLTAPQSGRRKLIALAGPPASGKSTLAERLAAALIATGAKAAVVPMDGFHLDNRILERRNLRDRKGAPDTFDALGLTRLLMALRADATAYYPIFDRHQDISIAGAGCISPECDTVIVEGNYLLYEAPIWRDIVTAWDFSIQLDVDIAVLEARLRQRWRDHKIPPKEAERRVAENDLVNARLVLENSLPPDAILKL